MSLSTVTCGNCRHEFAATGLFCPHCGRAKVRDQDGDVMLGKILAERFLVQEKIGQGTSGTIYRAEHVTLRRKVAIKVLHHELSRDDLALERFRREATTVGDIDNEHIVEIHDFGRTPDGRLYLAMELLDGDTLDKVLAREATLDFERIVDIVIQVGEGLIEAHAIGYVHRDIRPRNILLSVRRGRANFVKILDFGLTKLVDQEGTAASTSLGMTFGDPRYMSPEQARGDLIDRRADLYQLGCVAYEMLTGAPPFTGGRVFDVLARHVNEAPAPLSQRRRDVPPWLEAAVMRMLSKRADDRFATMSRMVEALRLGQQHGSIMPPETARQVETEVPASVSRVMEKLGRTSLGPHNLEGPEGQGDPAQSAPIPPLAPARDLHSTALGVPKAADVIPSPPLSPASLDDAVTMAVTKVGPRGTPKVGVPAMTAADAAAAPEPIPDPQASDTVSQRSPDPATPSKGGVWARPKVEPPPPSQPVLPPPGRTGGSGSTGKLPTRQRRPSAGDSAGISSVWFADGDQLDGGGELDENQARKLDRARRLQGTGESMSDSYTADKRRPVGKIAAIGVGAVLLVVLVVVVASGGSSKSPANKTVKNTVVDAAVGPVAIDAGVPALVVDGSVAAVVVDGGTGSGTGTGSAKAGTGKTGTGKTGTGKTGTGKTGGSGDDGSGDDGGDDGGGDDRVDPLDPIGDGGGSGSGIPDDEAKAKAEFYAKAGAGQLNGGDAQGAASNFKKALELDPKNFAAIMGLGEVAMQQGLYDAALKHFKRASKMKPGSPLIHTLMGECYLNSGNEKQAEASFKKALKIDPDNSRARQGYIEASSRIPPPEDDPE